MSGLVIFNGTIAVATDIAAFPGSIARFMG